MTVDIGSLTLIGPTHDGDARFWSGISGEGDVRQRTCISGQTCTLKSWQGVNLQDADHVLALDTIQQFIAYRRVGEIGRAHV